MPLSGEKLSFTNGKFDRLACPFASLIELLRVLGLFNDNENMLALCCPGESTGHGDSANGIKEGRLTLAFDPDDNFGLPDCLADSPRLS